MAQFDATQSEEAILTQIIQRIARKYNCTVRINYDDHTISFEGDESVKLAIARELESYFTCF